MVDRDVRRSERDRQTDRDTVVSSEISENFRKFIYSNLSEISGNLLNLFLLYNLIIIIIPSPALQSDAV